MVSATIRTSRRSTRLCPRRSYDTFEECETEIRASRKVGRPGTRVIVGHQRHGRSTVVLRILRRWPRVLACVDHRDLAQPALSVGCRSWWCDDCQHLVASVQEVERRESRL